MPEQGPICVLCGLTGHKAGHMIARDGGDSVCEHWIKAGMQMIEAKKARLARRNLGLATDLTPRAIYAVLEQYVIGQERAKKVLSVACYNHYKRIYASPEPGQDSEVEIGKSNILLIGPTGSGKTLLAETLAKAVDVPFAIADATTLTEAGYVGEDVENILLKLIQAANMDIRKAERGIIYIDEIDKCRRTSGNVSITRDVSGEGVQRGLLKIIEGTVSSVPPSGGRKHPEQEYLRINTKNILFILGGAFSGIEDIISKRLNKNTMGFASMVSGNEGVPSDEDERRAYMLSRVNHDDLMEFGLMPELVGRLPVLTGLMPLTEDEMIRILAEPKNAIIKQYQALFHMDNANLEYTREALLAIVAKARETETGARALRTITEELLLDAMFDLPDEGRGKKYILTSEIVKGKDVLKAA